MSSPVRGAAEGALDGATGGGAEVKGVREAGSILLPAPAAAFEGVALDGATRAGAPEGGVIGGAGAVDAVNVRADAGGAALSAGSACAGTTAIRGATRCPSGVVDIAAASARSGAAAGVGAGAPWARASSSGGAARGMGGAGATVEPLPSGGRCEGSANHKPLARKDTAAKATAVATAVRRNVADPRSGNVVTFSLSIRQTAAAVASPPAVPGRMRKSSCRRRPSIASLRSEDGERGVEPGEGMPSTRHSPLITGPRQGARPRGPCSGGAAAAARPRLRKTTSAAHRLLRPSVA
jgi:hypothetical protein